MAAEKREGELRIEKPIVSPTSEGKTMGRKREGTSRESNTALCVENS